MVLISEDLIRFLREKGYPAKIIDSIHLKELKRNSEKVYEENQIDKTLFQKYLAHFDYNLPTLNFTPQSILIVAVQNPQFELTFHYNQKTISALVPPTYLYWNRDQQRVLQTVNTFLHASRFQGNLVRLPDKLLAVQSGLAVYGRNNISYIEEFGSFHRLVVLASDLPCNGDRWTQPQLANSCPTCNACISNCPTKAIRSDRFLISAEKCLTYHNEQPNHIPFPKWIDPAWHNCLIGCMKCQDCCPMNRNNLLRREQGPSFSEEETTMLLHGVPSSQFPATLTQKLDDYDLADYLDVIPRNLRTLLDRSNI
jgi:epoxyqueuosine reductase